MSSEEFDALNEKMLRELFNINPDAGTRFGMHDPYDAMLPHGGVVRLERTRDLLSAWLATAERIAASGDLDGYQTTSLEVLRMSEELHRFAIDDYPQWMMFPEACEVPGGALYLMLVRDYSTLEEKVGWMSTRIGEIPRYLEQFKERFRPGKPAKDWTRMSIESAEDLPDFLRYLQVHFKGDVSTRLNSDLGKNIERALEAMEDHLEWLRCLSEHSSEDFSMGRDRLDKLLAVRGFRSTSDEILEFGETSLIRLKRERDEVATRMAPGQPPEAAVAQMRSDSPADFDLAFKETVAEVERARRFVIDNDIASSGYDARLHIVETPDFMETMIPTAALEMAAPFEERQQGILLITRASGEALGELYSRASIANLAVHEAYPGHFHQGVISNTKPWMHQLSLMLIEPDTMVPSWETQEGWGMYCEKMMMDRGFRTTLADQHAMLDYAIWRACRIVYDIKLARGEATVQDMVRMFMRETNCPRKVAEGEVLGFSRTPGYGLSYLTGRQMVFDLKDALMRELGGAFQEKRFHDLLAQNGNLPFHLAEREIRVGFGLKHSDA